MHDGMAQALKHGTEHNKDNLNVKTKKVSPSPLVPSDNDHNRIDGHN